MTERTAMIIGRAGEQSRLQRLIGEVKGGHSRSLVVRGEAGIGKSTLLDYAEAIAGDLRVLRVIGIESEAEFPYAGLQVLLAPFVDRLDGLPGPQARALRAVFGAADGTGDPMLVGAATLTLLSELAEARPLLCLLDDAHWFDRSSVAALQFAIRRLQADPVAMIFAARDGDRPFRADGIEDLQLRRLDHDQAARLLAEVRALPHATIERVLRETAGNPLAIIELAAEDPNRPDAPPMSPLPAVGRLEQHFRAQLILLPEPTRRALAVAAADHGSGLGLFTAVAARLGLDLTALEPAEAARLIRVAGSVEFRHPLIRAAAYQEVPIAGRLAIHRAWADTLADTGLGTGGADHRAWHLAAATAGVDDLVAAELETAARRALDRGAPAAASRAWERSALLSTLPVERARRLAEAARMAYDSGESDRADRLAVTVGPAAGPSERADAAWVRAQVAYERDSPSRACVLALEAVAPILRTDLDRADSMLAEAVWCARDSGDPDLLRHCAELLRSDPGPGVLRPALTGMTGLLLGDHTDAAAPMRAMLHAVRDGRIEEPVQRLTGGFLGILIGEDLLARSVLERQVSQFRDDGRLGWLPYLHEPLALAQLVTGRFRDAEVTLAEATSLAGELGQTQQVAVLTSIAAWLSAVRGDAAAGDRQAGEVLREGSAADAGPAGARHRMAAAMSEWALAILELTRPDPSAAADRLDRTCQGPARHDLTLRAIPDLVEAAARIGELDRARHLLPVLRDWAAQTESPPLLALTLRCEAITDPGDAAADLFERSLATAGIGPYDLARTRLAYGEWLRRHRRPNAAQDQLGQALATFDQLAALGWKGRVEAELTALGVALPDHPAAAGRGPGSLTPQELQVVRLAGTGLTNREIAAQLFLSPRTIGYHLYKAYPKLGVARRAELARLDL